MPINFQTAKERLRQILLQQRGPGGGAEFAQRFAQWYDQTVRQGGDAVFQNPVTSANLPALQSAITQAVQAPAPSQVFEQAIRTGIPAYWSGATLALAFPPPGTGPVVSNVVANPGTIQFAVPGPSESPDVFINTLVASIRQHLLTLSGVTTSLTPSPGGPVPVAFPWTGYQ